jgi:hypothetical protein
MIAKTRAGKSMFAMVLAGTMAMSLMGTDWEVWVLDTKGDPADLVGWRKWGFRNYVSKRDQETSLVDNAFYFRIDTKDSNGNDISVSDQCQRIINAAYIRGHVIICIDEYVSVIQSSRNPGKPLLDVFQRGGGRQVGLIGLTQEPVYVPRQLLSQATHIFLFTLTHTYDIEWAGKICPGYIPPGDQGYPHGFYYKWIDGPTNTWKFYRHQQDWYKEVTVTLPKPIPASVTPDAEITSVW